MSASPDTPDAARGQDGRADALLALVETLPLAIYSVPLAEDDAEPRFVAPQVAEVLGIPASEFTFDRLREGIHPDDRDVALAAFEEADRLRLPLKLEYRFVRPDGSVVWIEDSSRVDCIDGEWVAHGYLLDLSERKRTELELIRRGGIRRRIADLGRVALGGATHGEVVARALAIVGDAVQADAAAFLEPAGEELVVTDAFGWDAVGAVAQEGSPARTAFETRRPFVGFVEPLNTQSLRARLGARSSLAAPVLLDDGGCFGVLSVHSTRDDDYGDDDLSLVEQVANMIAAVVTRERLDQRLRVAQRLEVVGQLAAGVAHDFNNLLTAIVGYTCLALPHADDDGRTHLEQVERAAERARVVTSQLLAFSRKQTLRPERLRLADVVRAALPMLAPLLGENLEVRTELVDATVLADEAQLENVLVNLVANARDAMRDGGTVTIRCSETEVADALARSHDVEPGRYATLTVADTGVGMPPEVVARVFEPFFTTKAHGEGTGLGLASVHGIVRQSGGFVTVWSEPNTGTELTVHLPVATGPVTPTDDEPAQTTERGARVLLVEDEAVVRELLGLQLTSLGHQATAVADACEAFDALDREPFDVLLSDVGLPGLNGADLADEVAARRPEIRVLLMSGYPGERLAGRPWLLLQKPFGLDELDSALARALA